MQSRNVPATGPRYWAALCLASVFGANLGDVVSHTLRLGHWRGLLPLGLVFALTLRAERRVPAPGRAWYWLAIVTLRTAATNIGDLATHDAGLSAPACCAVLAVLTAALAARGTARSGAPPAPTGANAGANAGVPDTNGWYWAAMLAAGTFGTVAGDYASDLLGGAALSSLVLCAAVALCLGLRAARLLPAMLSYWLTVAAIRTAGTAVGDWTAFRHGLDLGLPLSTALSGAALLLAVALVSPRQSARDA